MEPKALANLNGTLVTPMKNNAGAPGAPAPRECQTAPNHHAGNNHRRDSTLWMRSPEGVTEEDMNNTNMGQDQQNWEDMLTPVPKTPAPETIAQFAMGMDFTPETPAPSCGGMDYDYGYGYEYDDSASNNGLGQDNRQQLLMRTCPPKQQQRDMFGNAGSSGVDGTADDEDILGAGHGSSSRENQSVLMRLMAARRKSLQFAPKVGSPLSKAWKE